jgi:hypothetical protein
MVNLDELTLTDVGDPRAAFVIDLLTRRVYAEEAIAAALEGARLVPGDYRLTRARLAWTEAVPDAARLGRLDALVRGAAVREPALLAELEQRLAELAAPPGAASWYAHADPLGSRFVGPGAKRAVVDRAELRAGLRALSTDDYRILLVSGGPRTGKSHTWVLIDHLRNTGRLAGAHRFVRVTTHAWSGPVTGEDMAGSVAAKLGVDLRLVESREPEETRVRKILDKLVGSYPQDDAVRWIVLDGLDRPAVRDSARDFARRMITLVDEGELPRTRLVVTGLDVLGLDLGFGVCTETIPAIDAVLVKAFLTDVAAHLARETGEAEIDALVAEVLPPGGPRDLRVVEEDLVRIVSERWGRARAPEAAAAGGVEP